MMSIVAAGLPLDLLPEAALAGACLALSVPIMLRLLWRDTFHSSDRLPPSGSGWPLAIALALGLLVWVMVPAAYMSWRGLLSAAAPATAPTTAPTTAPQSGPTLPPPERGFDLENLPAADVAFLSVVPSLCSFFVLLAIDLTLYGGDLHRLGFSARQARAGLWTGAALSVAIVPLVFGAAVGIEFLYRAVGYVHPPEHPLLHVMESAAPGLRIALVAGATLVAPLSEELLFRAHAQTVLRRVLVKLTGTGGVEVRTQRGFPLDNAPAGPVEAMQHPVTKAPPGWTVWVAIVLTSAAFASVHPLWTAPAIFLLSLCLGWSYERSGNLWTPVTVHAVFNTVSTFIFLKWGGG